jgi:molybdopterin biosynthesis enzyme MoaB
MRRRQREGISKCTPGVDPDSVLFHLQGKPKSIKEVMNVLIAKSQF